MIFFDFFEDDFIENIFIYFIWNGKKSLWRISTFTVDANGYLKI